MTVQFKNSIKTYLTGIFLFFLCLSSEATLIILANDDLKGEWTFNAQKSKLGDSNFPIAPLKLKVASDANGLNVERTSAGFGGGENMITTERLSFDGKETESTVFGTNKKKSIATWSADGKQLTVKATVLFSQNGNSMEFPSTEVWKLADDGKTLLIDYKSVSQFATINATFAYDKVN